MASRHLSTRLVAFCLILAACTSGAQGTEPTAPQDVFAPTPSIGELGPATTKGQAPGTTTDRERMVIYPVDPLTLEALPGYEPIPMGDWTWGMSSPNGEWLALMYGHETGGVEGLRLVDLANWRLVGDWPHLSLGAMSVGGDGVIHAVSWSSPTGTLIRVAPGVDVPETIFALSPQFSPWGQPAISGDRLVLVGQTFDESTPSTSEILVNTIELTSGASTETVIPDVTIGGVVAVELEGDRVGIHDAFPAVVSGPNGEVLVVDAREDVVALFDPATNQVSHHRFGPLTHETTGAEVTQEQLDNAAGWATTRRTGALSPDGEVLYVSGTVGRFVEGRNTVTVENSPWGIVAVDTATWEIVASLDAPVSDLYLSPDGGRLIGLGFTEQSSPTYRYESSGIYLIDAAGLEVVAHHPPSPPDQSLGSVSINPYALVAYVTSYAGREQVDVIDLANGQILATRQNITLVGNIGVVAESTFRN